MERSCCSCVEVEPLQLAKMESMPGRSGNSHPCRLVEQRREEYSKHPLLVYMGFFMGFLAAYSVLPKVLHELKKCVNFFSFWWAYCSEDSKISDIHDIFSNVSIFSIDKQHFYVAS